MTAALQYCNAAVILIILGNTNVAEQKNNTYMAIEKGRKWIEQAIFTEKNRLIKSHIEENKTEGTSINSWLKGCSNGGCQPKFCGKTLDEMG